MKITHISLALFAVALAGCGSKTTETPSAPETVDNMVAPATKTTPIPTSVKSTNKTDPTVKLTPINANGAKPDATKYRVRGQVTGTEKSIGDGRMTLIVKHEDIPKFMPAMEMRMPFANDADAKKIKAGDKIVFDLKRSNLEVSNFQVLPPSTQLKLGK